MKITQQSNSCDSHYQPIYKSLCQPVVRTTLLCTILFGNVVSVPRLSWCKMVPTFSENDNPWLPFSTLHLLPQVSLNYLPANRRMNLLFLKFSQTLNHANLVNHWKPFSWMLKFLLLDSNGTILTMLRERKGHKSLFIFGCVEIPHRCPVAIQIKICPFVLFPREARKSLKRKKRSTHGRAIFSLYYVSPTCNLHRKKNWVHERFGSLDTLQSTTLKTGFIFNLPPEYT